MSICQDHFYHASKIVMIRVIRIVHVSTISRAPASSKNVSLPFSPPNKILLLFFFFFDSVLCPFQDYFS